ncbi:MAG: DNA-3-methyladenine glycosylase 2 family protein [Clostridiales bacterium]|nr:DNA-3-methyladenine glycosylase 2 family protein [Clostridiales bacterium]
MKNFYLDCKYFNIKDTLDCGQIFRYRSFNDGFLVFSGDKVCYAKEENGQVAICSFDEEYFKNYFDVSTDYSKINSFAISSGYGIVSRSAEKASGVRILRQQKEEMLFSFIISQNNMIPRIKAIIERTCKALGEKREFLGEEYYTFPSAKILAEQSIDFYKELGYGYRASYMVEVAKAVSEGKIDLEKIAELPTEELKKALISLKGVGAKVADCISLFGYHRTDSFPVDTWIEKIYREDFCGTLKDRKKIAEWFLNEFKEYSGYVQQYVFYYKRSLEKDEN